MKLMRDNRQDKAIKGVEMRSATALRKEAEDG